MVPPWRETDCFTSRSDAVHLCCQPLVVMLGQVESLQERESQEREREISCYFDRAEIVASVVYLAKQTEQVKPRRKDLDMLETGFEFPFLAAGVYFHLLFSYGRTVDLSQYFFVHTDTNKNGDTSWSGH